MTTKRVDLLQGERVELHYPRLRAECGWHNAPRFIFGIYLHNYPCFMLAVHAAPICACQKVGSGPEKDLGGPRTLCRCVLVRDLNEKSCHWTRSPLSFEGAPLCRVRVLAAA